jgi:hypothetical protein
MQARNLPWPSYATPKVPCTRYRRSGSHTTTLRRESLLIQVSAELRYGKGGPRSPTPCASRVYTPYHHTAVTPMSATPHPVCSRHTLPRTRRIRGRTLGTDLVFMFGPQMRAAASIAAASSRWPMSVSGNNCQHLQLIALSQRNYLEG